MGKMISAANAFDSFEQGMALIDRNRAIVVFSDAIKCSLYRTKGSDANHVCLSVLSRFCWGTAFEAGFRVRL